jgi:hypothetical protein
MHPQRTNNVRSQQFMLEFRSQGRHFFTCRFAIHRAGHCRRGEQRMHRLALRRPASEHRPDRSAGCSLNE